MQLPDVAYVTKYKGLQRVFHSYFYDLLKQNATTTTKHLNSVLNLSIPEWSNGPWRENV